MITLQFQADIKATVEKVYKTMLEQETFRQWTAEFNPSSRYKGSWEKGSKILFIADGKEGKIEGMVSRIRENIPNEFVSIELLGVLDGNTEITSGKAVEGWAGALENYTFENENGNTRVRVSMDTQDDWKDYFEKTWPGALARLKQICEG